MVIIREGDVLKSGAPLIAHQVNCKGVMGSGVARQIREKYPEAFKEYRNFCNLHNLIPYVMLGRVNIVKCKDDIYIANLFAQYDYARDKYDTTRYTDYNAFNNTMSFLYNFCISMRIDKIAMPYGIGAGKGNGDWETILMLIERHFKKTNKIICELWRI